MLQGGWRLFAFANYSGSGHCSANTTKTNCAVYTSRELCFIIKANKEEHNMSGIVCAIRGGPDCQSTVAYAIVLAKQTGLSLHFLYVVDLNLPERAGGSYAHNILEKIHEMGKAVLGAAQARATAQGIAAGGVVRQGSVGDEIIALCRDLGADYVVLGGSEVQQEGSTFTKGLLMRLGERIGREAGSQVFLTKHGDARTGSTVG
jgi:nucleotide-binding universal stress UspA family protein